MTVYDLRQPGGRRRLHLRTNADGTAVLLVDATDAIHLNQTAALLDSPWMARRSNMRPSRFAAGSGASMWPRPERMPNEYTR